MCPCHETVKRNPVLWPLNFCFFSDFIVKDGLTMSLEWVQLIQISDWHACEERQVCLSFTLQSDSDLMTHDLSAWTTWCVLGTQRQPEKFADTPALIHHFDLPRMKLLKPLNEQHTGLLKVQSVIVIQSCMQSGDLRWSFLFWLFFLFFLRGVFYKIYIKKYINIFPTLRVSFIFLLTNRDLRYSHVIVSALY